MIQLQRKEHGCLLVSGEATIFEAAVLRDLLVEAAKTEPAPESLDLAQLTALDTAGVQVLIAFKRQYERISVHSCPEPLRSRLEQTGLLELLV